MSIPTKKKILFLITKSYWGGAQRYVFDIATHLNPNEFEVTVALGGNGPLLENLRSRHINVIQLKNLERDISISKEFKSAYELHTILRSLKPDILHINSSKAGGIGTFVGRLCCVPHIIFTGHGWAFNENRPLWQKYFIKFLHWVTILLSHSTIVVSETAKQQMSLPFTQHKMRVIHNGCSQTKLFDRDVSRAFLSSHIPELEKYKSDFWSVTIGELHRIKQHDVAIRACAKVIQTHPNARHIIIGAGEERANLEVLVTKLNLTRNVFFTGHISDASQYLKAFDIFILASKSEGLAYVIIEACIAGLPIIASNVGGIPEIVTHGHSGILFPEGNVEMLAEQYAELYANPMLRNTLSMNAQLTAIDFSFEKMFDRTIEIYSSGRSHS